MLDRITQMTAGANVKLPECFYTLAATLAGMEAYFGQELPAPYKGMVQDAIQATTCCVSEYAKTPEQREAEEGLDLAGYSGKWKRAQEYVDAHVVAKGQPEYWAAVRQTFLELGGCLLSQMPTSDPRHPAHI